MSFNIEGKQCKVCNAYLFPEDDVVFCPECGAPYHRDCYNSLGHCALEHLHGTSEQYDSSKEEKAGQTDTHNEQTGRQEEKKVLIKCNMCGENYSATENACPNCNTPNPIKLGGRYVAFDFLGGVPAETDLGEGVTAEEAKRFVYSNTQRFIPKFMRMKNGQKASFNVLAFFFPCAWALSRKMYKLGAFLGAVTVSLSMLLIPFSNMLISSVPEDVAKNYSRFALYLTENIEFFNNPAMYVAFASSLLMLAVRIIMAVFGDYFYRNHTIKTVKEIKETSEDIENDMKSKGGVSLMLLILGILLTEYLPAIISGFAGF